MDKKIRMSTTTATGTGVDISNDNEELNDEPSSYGSIAYKHVTNTEATNGTDSLIFDGSCIIGSASNISAVSVSICIYVLLSFTILYVVVSPLRIQKHIVTLVVSISAVPVSEVVSVWHL